MPIDRVDAIFERDMLMSEGDAFRRIFGGMPSDDWLIDGDRTPEDYRAPIAVEEEPIDLHGLSHEQLELIGLAEARVVELLRQNEGDPKAAFLANGPSDDETDLDQRVRNVAWDMFIDTQLMEKLVAKAETTPEAEDHRIGHTKRHIEELRDAWADDADVASAVEYVIDTVADWKDGFVSARDTLRRLYRRYYETDGSVSEEASVVYYQAASLAFGFEADISEYTDEVVHSEIKELMGVGPIRYA